MEPLNQAAKNLSLEVSMLQEEKAAFATAKAVSLERLSQLQVRAESMISLGTENKKRMTTLSQKQSLCVKVLAASTLVTAVCLAINYYK